MWSAHPTSRFHFWMVVDLSGVRHADCSSHTYHSVADGKIKMHDETCIRRTAASELLEQDKARISHLILPLLLKESSVVSSESIVYLVSATNNGSGCFSQMPCLISNHTLLIRHRNANTQLERSLCRKEINLRTAVRWAFVPTSSPCMRNHEVQNSWMPLV